MKKNILIVGGGGREHALAWKLAQSPRIGTIFMAPGNSGTQTIAVNIAIPATDVAKLVSFAKNFRVHFVVVGPEAPLVAGIIDELRKEKIPAFGPTAMAAQLEASKIFTKTRCRRWNIPSADFDFAGCYKVAENIIKRTGFRIIKTDGLCEGKGVVVTDSEEEALEAVRRFYSKQKGRWGGPPILIEEKLKGHECSVIALCDGKDAVLLPPARDYKRAFEGDKGPNTGGMGSYCPLPDVNNPLLAEIKERIILPTLRGMEAWGEPYRGVLYAGIMITKDGPKLLEYNARFGDPETQSQVRLLKTDILDVVEACANGTLGNLSIETHAGASVCVVFASGGYPGWFAKDIPITGITRAERIPGVVVFHAGTGFNKKKLVTLGGRVLNVTAIGDTLEDALSRAYEAAEHIQFEGMYYRRDIGAELYAKAPYA